MKASILAVGTELTTGQVINRNAATISEKLKDFGINSSVHLTVPDDRQVIYESLKYLEEQSDLIFITGGLGPTTDDFTRDVVADWAMLPMKYDEASWQHITERILKHGFKLQEIQKQQCYFPESADILFNAMGTAHGFKFQIKRPSGQKTVFVLPGPPREIESIWKDHLHSWLADHTKNIDKTISVGWDTIGAPESEVAVMVEQVLESRPQGHLFEIGYRVHHPYVEVKLIFRESEKLTWQKWVDEVEKVLAPITVTRDFVDIVELISPELKKIDFTFYDYVSCGFLHTRLSSTFKNLPNFSFKQNQADVVSVDFFEVEDQFFALLPLEEDTCICLFSINGERFQKTIEAPMKASVMTERRKQFFAEMGLVELAKYF